MSTRSALLASCCSLLLLSGCATDGGIPAEQYYQAPALAEAQAAHILGSTVMESGLFATNHVGFVLMIDSRFVANGADNWNQVITLSPGWHRLTTQYSQSVFSARAEFRIEVRPGASYEVRIAPGVEDPDERRYCNLSIVDVATGQAVTPVKHANVSGGQNAGRSLFRAVD
ncbi:MAG: hypothetical protein WCL24_09190 [Verrucomicrobiota bacterium]